MRDEFARHNSVLTPFLLLFYLVLTVAYVKREILKGTGKNRTTVSFFKVALDIKFLRPIVSANTSISVAGCFRLNGVISCTLFRCIIVFDMLCFDFFVAPLDSLRGFRYEASID